jgi:transcription antitermination factor NusG
MILKQSTNKDTAWYAIHVRSRFEKAVSWNLRGKGYEEFLPLYVRRARWSDRIKDVQLPLFPGYVFCQFDVNHRLPILTVPGVNAIVGIGKTPTAIEPVELESVRSVLLSHTQCEPWPYLAIGERVRVESGPLAGTEGIVQLIKNVYRLVISINLLQRSVAVEIDRDCLKQISGNTNSYSFPQHNNSAPVIR